MRYAAGNMPGDEFELCPTETIAIFRDLPPALLAQSLLESAGIESYLFDADTIRMDWFWSNLLGGVKLAVSRAEAMDAVEVLSQPIPEIIEFEQEVAYHQPHCPNCQSLDISFEGLYEPLAYGSLFINLPIPAHRKGWNCKSCKETCDDFPHEPAT